jgi:transposase-like protein
MGAMQHSEDDRSTGGAGRTVDGESEAVELDGPILTVAAVASRLGVAPATLRTWDRRYGLGPSEHTAGAHRRYSASDLARLVTMRSLTLDGVPPADAARLAREGAPATLPEPAGSGERGEAPARPDHDGAAGHPVGDDAAAGADAVTAAGAPVRHLIAVPDAPAGATDARGADSPARGADAAARGADAPVPGPGRPSTSAGPSGAPAARTARTARAATPTAVIDAALRADAAEVARLLALPSGGDLVGWWSGLVAPARAGIASRTVLARPGDEPDALVVASALAVLRDRSGRVPRHPSRRRIVLLLAAPGEPRPLSLHVLAGALADAGVDARVVAGPTGRHRLLEIAAMTSPSAVVLLSDQTAPDLGLVDAVTEAHAELPVFVMVPDEAAGEVPLGRQVHRVRTVPGLVHEVLAVCA